MLEWSEYAGIKLQVKCIATNFKYQYKLSFSLEMSLDFDKIIH